MAKILYIEESETIRKAAPGRRYKTDKSYQMIKTCPHVNHLSQKRYGTHISKLQRDEKGTNSFLQAKRFNPI
jgi:hypothetical protein